MGRMDPTTFCHLADIDLLNKFLGGEKPCCVISNDHLAQFAQSLFLKVIDMPFGFGMQFVISRPDKVKIYFQLEDVLGIVNTELAHKLYKRIENYTPAAAFVSLSKFIQKNGERVEAAVLLGFLCGYPVCDIVEYAKGLMLRNRNRNGIYWNRSATDYHIHHILCAECRREYVANG